MAFGNCGINRLPLRGVRVSDCHSPVRVVAYMSIHKIMQSHMRLLEPSIRASCAYKKHAVGTLYHATVDVFEKALIENVIRYAKFNQVRAAQILGIHRNTVRSLLKKHGLWDVTAQNYWEWRRENGSC